MLDVASVAKRARGENFPVASLAFPRELRPHIRALYAYARLVDILGDELEGGAEARLAALDELEREVDAAFVGEATWPVLRNVQPTIHEFELPREPFLRLIEANRMDQRIASYESSTGRTSRSAVCSSSRAGGRAACWRRANRLAPGSEAGPDVP